MQCMGVTSLRCVDPVTVPLIQCNIRAKMEQHHSEVSVKLSNILYLFEDSEICGIVI